MRDVQDLDIENFKPLLSEIKENISKDVFHYVLEDSILLRCPSPPISFHSKSQKTFLECNEQILKFYGRLKDHK